MSCTLSGRPGADGTGVMLFHTPEDLAKYDAQADAGATDADRLAQSRAAGGVLVELGTPCEMLNLQGGVVLVRVTHGAAEGTQGYVPAGAVVTRAFGSSASAPSALPASPASSAPAAKP